MEVSGVVWEVVEEYSGQCTIQIHVYVSFLFY